MKKTIWTKLDSTTPTKINLSSSVCSHHNPMNDKLRYGAWQEWAERKAKQGHIQKQCPECGRWYFKCEW